MRVIATDKAERSPGLDFLGIGAQRAGTRWLYDQSQHHPDFWMPPIKELHYFDARARTGYRTFHEQAVADTAGTNKERRLWPAKYGL